MKLLSLIFLSFISIASIAQVSVSTTGALPDQSSMLDVSASNKGALIPRMTTLQRKEIANPAVGLLVYDTDRQTIYLFDGQKWRALAVATENNLAPVERQGSGEITATFGRSVAMHGDYAIVGAPGETVNGVNAGAAYIYYKNGNGWQQQAKISASNGSSGDRFGYSVDIYNDIAVVGAPYKAVSNVAFRGRVYVFKRTGTVWNQVVGLLAPNGAQGDNFGWNVAVYNNILLASAPFTDHSVYQDAGTIYPFAFSNGSWTPRGEITLNPTKDNVQFGYGFDFWGNTLVAGSYYEAVNGINCGALYTYTTNADATTWINGTKLYPSTQLDWMHFGSAVAIKGDYMVAGAPGYNSPGTIKSGAWFSFRRVNGVWQSYTAYLSTEDGSRMGSSVAIDGETIYAGAEQWNTGKGRVVAYDSYGQYIYNPDPYRPATFGSAVAADNGHYLIGAPLPPGSAFFGVLE